MAKLFRLSSDQLPPKRRSKLSKEARLEELGQLNLFSGQEKIISLDSGMNAFEIALCLDTQNDTRAEEYYRKAIQKGLSTADALCNLGVIKFNQKNHIVAIDYLTQSLAMIPRHFEAHFNLANVYLEAEQTHLAILHFEIAKQIDNSEADVYYNLALAYALAGNVSAAKEILVAYKHQFANPDGEAEQLFDLIAKNQN